jgi:hypothetical protein
MIEINMGQARKQREQANNKKPKIFSEDEASLPDRAPEESEGVEKVFGPLLDKLHSVWLAWDNRPIMDRIDLKDLKLVKEMVSYLGSSERLKIARKLEDAYYRNRSIENYVKFRREVPGVEIDAEYFFDYEQFSYLKKELARHGIDTECLFGVFDGFEPDIDELCLQLLEAIIAKKRLPKSGPGYIDKRKSAISESFIDYLVVVMVELIAWKGQYERTGVLPKALLVLIRERLCGSNPDAFEEARKSDKKGHFMRSLYRALEQSRERASVRTLAKAMGISKSKLDRVLQEDPRIRDFIVNWKHPK